MKVLIFRFVSSDELGDVSLPQIHGAGDTQVALLPGLLQAVVSVVGGGLRHWLRVSLSSEEALQT